MPKPYEMNAWSNIQISSRDHEIIGINAIEASIRKLPKHVYKIRELITRHEVCHFKYQQHIKKIKDSIINLEPVTAPEKIGTSHIRHGKDAWKSDTTGRSLLGQQYVWAIIYWLDDMTALVNDEKYDQELSHKVQKWLGNKNADKIRLVQLLIARLTWDWLHFEELKHGGKYKKLELQISMMDICHYAFPSNLDRLLRGIGEMNPLKNFEGCGSFDSNIRVSVEKELLVLNDLFKSYYNSKRSNKKSQIKAWLFACLMKTLKEQTNLSEPLINLQK